MTFLVTFKVLGDPVGKGRPRFARVGNFVKTYTPQKTVTWEESIGFAAKQAMGSSEPVKTPVSIYIYIRSPIPKSYSKKRREACLNHSERPTKKPDWDNVSKSVCDAINGIVYDDDTQVVDAFVTKFYAEESGVEVLVREI
jgi:Holliday junction resolvase RusA-like endonuclease